MTYAGWKVGEIGTANLLLNGEVIATSDLVFTESGFRFVSNRQIDLAATDYLLEDAIDHAATIKPRKAFDRIKVKSITKTSVLNQYSITPV